MIDDRCICNQEEGCKVDSTSPLYPMCLMAFAKQSWEEAAIPLKDSDWDIIFSMEKVKADFDKTRRNKRINVDAKVGF